MKYKNLILVILFLSLCALNFSLPVISQENDIIEESQDEGEIKEEVKEESSEEIEEINEEEPKAIENPPVENAIPESTQVPSQPAEKKRGGLFSLKKSYEIKEKSNKELNSLYQEGKRERSEVKQKEKLEKSELYLKEKKERAEIRERYRQEKLLLKQRQEARKEEIKKVRNEKLEAKGQINDRLSEIRRARWKNKHVDIITNDQDPIYILEADVLEGKTSFLGIKEVDLNYKITIQNQTPKIVNSILIIWERRIPFTETLTIARKSKVSKPMIPYEKRVIEFNDLNSRREGELYRVKIAKVLFEDGTQWKNPSVREIELK